MKRRVKAIVAIDRNLGMAKDGKIPWRVKEDFEYFKKYTAGATCVMGRKTYLDMLDMVKDKNDPLPGRKIIVVTSTPIFGVVCVESLDQLNHLYLDEELILCGGKRIYEEGRKTFIITEFSVTEIDGEYNCDTFLNYGGCNPEMTFATMFPLVEGSPHQVVIYYNDRG